MQKSLEISTRWRYRLLVLSALFLIHPVQVRAVALGAVEVASHLSEPFYAEVPVFLDESESISNIIVEIASPADYRILEIYRDPGLNALTIGLEADKRGMRVEISSEANLTVPFFNLVLKVRAANGATHFKKYPVFLEMPKIHAVAGLPPVAQVMPGQERTARGQSAQQPPPQTSLATPVEPADETGAAGEVAAVSQPAFAPYDGWARTSNYGPMVYGDTVTTVAKRLRVDERYSLQQVMVALYEKNKSKFSQDNINLINAGTYLDVPRAAEVEAVTSAQAESVMADHNRRWAELKKQPRYAAIAEAQRTRYSKRVRVGDTAVGAPGTAAAPVSDESVAVDSGYSSEPVLAQGDTVSHEADEEIARLRDENAALAAGLKEAEDKIAAMASRKDEAGMAAADERIKKLELRLARLQKELDESRKSAGQSTGEIGIVTYALGGLIVVLLGVIGFLMRRERPHPAQIEPAPAQREFQVEPRVDTSVDDDSAEALAVAAAEAAAAHAVEEEPVLPGLAAHEHELSHVDTLEEDVPDLSELDTADMEAFEGTISEKEPDPSADYLAEADVYLRYGMEDEAEHNLRMAIKQHPDKADAYSKLFHLISGRAGKEGLEQVIAEGREMLFGEELARFESDMAKAEEFTDTVEEPAVTAGEKEFDIDATVILDVDDIGPRPLESVKPEEFEDTLSGLQAGEDLDIEVEGEAAGESAKEESAAAELEQVGETESEELKNIDLEESTATAGESLSLESGPATTGAEIEYEVGGGGGTSEAEAGEAEAVKAGESQAAGAAGEEEAEAVKYTAEEFDSELSLSAAEMEATGGKRRSQVPKDVDQTVKIDLSMAGDEMPDLETEAPAAEESGPSDDEFTDTIAATLGELRSGEMPAAEDMETPGGSGVDTGEADTLKAQTVSAEEPRSDSAEEDTRRETVRPIREHDQSGVIDMSEHDLGGADIERELDTLILELEAGSEVGSVQDDDVAEVSAAQLVIDTGRSQLESGALDEAEATFKRALDGDTRGKALLGLAEVAQRRGDGSKAADLLAQAEPALADTDRPLYEKLVDEQSG